MGLSHVNLAVPNYFWPKKGNFPCFDLSLGVRNIAWEITLKV